MRWDNLLTDADEGRTLPGYRDPARIRTFDAPEALDVRFYEVRAKSALNRVPERSRMPFRWTINPYRGCTHACSYCLSPSTPVLSADGRTSPISDLRPGDPVYGTVREGLYRRYAITRVLAHWETRQEAHRVTLQDGTELIASADHRLLSDRGWKHVTGRQGPLRRPSLVVGDRLMGMGRATEEPSSRSGHPGATTRERSIAGTAVECHAALGVTAIEPLGETIPMFDITTGTGDFIANGVVSHNCFARPTHTYLDFDAGRDFEREIVVKANLPEVLRAELARPSWKREHVALGTNTDPYQWVESRYRLMPEVWEALLEADTPCSVLTKSPLLLRDLDVMRRLHERVGFTANVSVPTLDEKAWRASEPHTPHPRKRLEALSALNQVGIPTGVLIAPLMPGINDSPEQVERILELAGEAGADHVAGITLHLRGEVRGIFMEWLRSYRPDIVQRYERLYARSAYAPRAERERHSRLARDGGGRRLQAETEPPPGEQGLPAGSRSRQETLF